MKKNILLGIIITIIISIITIVFFMEYTKRNGNVEKISNKDIEILPEDNKDIEILSKDNKDIEILSEDNEKCDNMYINADMAFKLDSTEKISERATVMVKGEVIDSNSFTIKNNDTPQAVTLVKVKVLHDYKGKIQDGQEVYFIQHGGVVKLKDLEIPSKDFDEKDMSEMDNDKLVNVILNGVEVSKKGEQVLFFAVERADDFYKLNLGEIYYETVGNYQGRFDLDEETNKFIRKEAIKTNIDFNSQTISSYSSESNQLITIPNDEVELKKISEF